MAAVTLSTLSSACDRRSPTQVDPVVDPAPTLPDPPSLRGAEVSSESATRKVAVDPGATEPRPVLRAIATLLPAKDSKVKGTIRFESAGGADQLDVIADVEGLPPGKHAFHVHVLGDCSAPDGKSAGPHFNFEGSSLAPPADIKRITGDLGELTADAQGVARFRASIAKAKLHGPYSILGRSVVVHEKPNDPTKPPEGGAGARLGCGVIGIDAADVPKK